jgi:hypothetical protein
MARSTPAPVVLLALLAFSQPGAAQAAATPCPASFTFGFFSAEVLEPAAAGYTLTGQLHPGDAYYADRSRATHALAALPEEPGVLCSRWLLTREDDRLESAEEFLRLELGDTGGRLVARVYVGYDTRAISPPDWLAEGFTDTGLTIDVSAPDAAQEFALFRSKQTFAPGEPIVLGGNLADGAQFPGGVTGSSYVVVLSPEAVLPFAPIAVPRQAPLYVTVDLGSLPPRPEIVFSIAPPAVDAEASIEPVECAPREELFPDPREIFLVFSTYGTDAQRQGASCLFRVDVPPVGPDPSYFFSVTAESVRPRATGLTGCVTDPEGLCILQSGTFESEGDDFRWVDDGTPGVGTCALTGDPDDAPVSYAYVQPEPGAGDWDCCTWRFDGIDGVTSTVGQLVFQNDGVEPPPDTDGDQILDPCDNCPALPNGPALGSCVTGDGTPGAACETTTECPPGQPCSLDQEDSNLDGVGDACPEPEAGAAALVAATALGSLAAARRRERGRQEGGRA